jgi:hypothetical protein
MKPKCGSVSDIALLRRLLAAGCPMPPQIEQQSLSDLIIEVGKHELTVAYDRPGSSEYVFSVRITNRSYARLHVREYRADSPWKRRLFLLAEPQSYLHAVKEYRLESGRIFRYDEVLNHRVGKCGGLAPGESMEGLLLGLQISCRIPFDFLHATIVPARISVVDQFGREHESEIEVRVDRSATMRPLNRKRQPKGLFAETGTLPMALPRDEAAIHNAFKCMESAESMLKNLGKPKNDASVY